MRVATWLMALLTAAILWAVPGRTFAVPINITEVMNGGVQVPGNGQPQVGGIVLICDGPVSRTVGSPPNPLRNLCGGPGLPNNGISDIVAFLPNLNGLFVPTVQGAGGGNQLLALMASDADVDALPADLRGLVFPNPPGFLPNQFVRPPIVAITETLGLSGGVEYQPGAGQPGYSFDVSDPHQSQVYRIFSDCSPVSAACGTPLPQPQTPQDTFFLAPPIPEPETATLMLFGLAALVLGHRRRSSASVPQPLKIANPAPFLRAIGTVG